MLIFRSAVPQPVALPVYGDSVVNNFEIDPFVLALTDSPTYVALYCGGDAQLAVCRTDINGDGATNNFDIDPFVGCLTSGFGCP